MSRMLGYSQKEDNPVLYPAPFSAQPKAGRLRVQVKPRYRSADMARLAKAHGWDAATTAVKTAELIARKGGHDAYIPRTKAVTRVNIAPTAKNSPDISDFMSGKVDGDYDDLVNPDRRKASLRTRVREAVALGLIAPEDAPKWAQPR